jgi:hypothetical protein
MKIEGAIHSAGGVSFDKAAWCRLIERRPELRHPAPREIINPFNRKPTTVQPPADMAEVVLDGRVFGSASWSTSDEPIVNVSVEAAGLPLVQEWAAELGGVFVPYSDAGTRGETQMEARQYYPCEVQLDGVTRVVAWYSDDRDGFLRDAGGRLVVADDADALGVPLEEAEPVRYDFDLIRAWCAAPNAAGVDCREFLNAWNFLDDLTGLHTKADMPHTRLSRAAAGEYDKLFWGNNLPAVTPPGERFEPTWSPEELAAIRGVFESGLGVLAAELARSVS